MRERLIDEGTQGIRRRGPRRGAVQDHVDALVALGLHARRVVDEHVGVEALGVGTRAAFAGLADALAGLGARRRAAQAGRVVEDAAGRAVAEGAADRPRALELLEPQLAVQVVERLLGEAEQAAGDGPVALIFRNLEALNDTDTEKLKQFAIDSGFAVFLQPGGVNSVVALWPLETHLEFAIPKYDIRLAFKPLDFIQVNAALNQKMIDQAIAMLDPQAGDCSGQRVCPWRRV